jgi:non-canonical purine NTP pyrophosphatase (RdgB/HAM1 family)
MKKRMKQLIFATNNRHKLSEVRDIVSDGHNILSLNDIGCKDDIPETAPTLEGNALQKARYISEHYGRDCFADDTGLEVEALDGAPGVYSARYAGEQHDSQANIRKLLAALDGIENRKARFRTVIALIINNVEHLFEGIVNGRIISEKRGYEGFGYDSVFVPEGSDMTFAEMPSEEKNKISHRARATAKLVDYLRNTALTAILLCSIGMLPAQTNKSDWNTYSAYTMADNVAETGERVFVVSEGALFSYGKEYNDITIYNKQNGLNDTDINLIRYNPTTKTLLIIYSNGNIDLLDKDGFSNMPQLKQSSSVQNKTVNDVFFRDNLAYLSSAFGILVINLTKKEVVDTYRLDKNINTVCISGDNIYAGTDNGVLTASIKDNLLDKKVWKQKNFQNQDLNDKKAARIVNFNNNIIYLFTNAGLFYENPDGQTVTLYGRTDLINLTLSEKEMISHSNDLIAVFYDLAGYFDYIESFPVKHVSSYNADGMIWVATGRDGLAGLKYADHKLTKTVSDITINCPKRNYNAFMTIDRDRLFITGGARSIDRHNIPGTLIILNDDKWENFDEKIANDAINQIIGADSKDYLAVAIDPNDENHYFIATYGEGIIELNDNQFVALYNERNSPLVSAIPGDPKYVRIGTVKFDDKGNLWSTNCRAPNALNILKPNGEWVALNYPPINDANRIDKILMTSKGQKWVNIPDEGGIFVLDDAGTPDNIDDDRYNFFSSFRDAQSGTGEYLTPNRFMSMAEDRTGTVWVGTNLGLLRFSTPSRAIDNPEQFGCSRLVRDNEAYFLSGELVTAIAVDAQNQKWLGTATQGVFLINEDGSETVYNFTTDNSPLLSNTINTIAINDKTGEVFFGTDKGLVSFKSGVTSGTSDSKFSNVYAYPNPVRPDFNDKVTITGLQNNTNVKITDINGNIICQGRSTGINFVWNCRSMRGERVATGVYLVLASTNDGSESVVTKIAVVR